MDWIVRKSYVLFSILLIGAGIAYTWFTEDMTLGLILTLIVLAATLIFFVTARRGLLTPANPEKRIRKARGGGRPAVVHFYHDYHLGSLVKRALGSAVEADFKGRCDFVFIDIAHREGPAVAASLEAELGQFVLFDAAGSVVDRVGMLTHRKLDDLLERPVGQS